MIRIAKRQQSLNTPHNKSQFLINNQKELTKEHFNNKDINSDDDLDFIVSGSMIGKMNTAFTSEDGDSVTTWEDEQIKMQLALKNVYEGRYIISTDGESVL